jgi:hypothetical protein
MMYHRARARSGVSLRPQHDPTTEPWFGPREAQWCRASADELWEMWTTKEGFGSWWAPEGFRAEVHSIEARVNGKLHYEMIADTPEMVAAMKEMGCQYRMSSVPGSPSSGLLNELCFRSGWISFRVSSLTKAQSWSTSSRLVNGCAW